MRADEAALLEALSVLDAPPARPMNRHERRALEKAKAADSPPPALGEGSASEREAREGGRQQSDLRALLLDSWAAARGPLLDDPQAAVLRAVSYAACAHLSRNARDPAVRKWAGSCLVRHGRFPQGAPADPEKLATARRLLLRVQQIEREFSARPDLDRTERLCAALRRASGDYSLARQIEQYGWAELLEGALFAAEALRLRCARMLLNHTLPQARKTGAGPAQELSEEEKKLLEEIRAGRANKPVSESKPSADPRPSAQLTGEDEDSRAPP